MTQPQAPENTYPHLPPRYRMWLWILGTLLATPALMGILFQLARITEVPLISVFAPCVLLAQLTPEKSHLLVAYLLMPLQALVYGGLLARSELTGRRGRVLGLLLLVHVPLALLALWLTRGTV
jgi:hypothetical protein